MRNDMILFMLFVVMISFYTTTEGKYNMTIQYGSTIDGSQGNTYINDYFENNTELNGNDIIVTLMYEGGEVYKGTFLSDVDGNYNITPR